MRERRKPKQRSAEAWLDLALVPLGQEFDAHSGITTDILFGSGSAGLGAYYRRVAANKGADIAVFATARKLATLIYRMLRWGQTYVGDGAAAYEKRYQATRIRRMDAAANQLGYPLVPTVEVASYPVSY